MLHVLDGSWKPNDEDKKNKLTPGKKQVIQANKLREHMSLVVMSMYTPEGQLHCGGRSTSLRDDCTMVVRSTPPRDCIVVHCLWLGVQAISHRDWTLL